MTKVYVIVNQWEPYPGALELQENVGVTLDEEMAKEIVDYKSANARKSDKFFYETWDAE
jgi:hypothetical protein